MSWLKLDWFSALLLLIATCFACILRLLLKVSSERGGASGQQKTYQGDAPVGSDYGYDKVRSIRLFPLVGEPVCASAQSKCAVPPTTCAEASAMSSGSGCAAECSEQFHAFFFDRLGCTSAPATTQPHGGKPWCDVYCGCNPGTQKNCRGDCAKSDRCGGYDDCLKQGECAAPGLPATTMATATVTTTTIITTTTAAATITTTTTIKANCQDVPQKEVICNILTDNMSNDVYVDGVRIFHKDGTTGRDFPEDARSGINVKFDDTATSIVIMARDWEGGCGSGGTKITCSGGRPGRWDTVNSDSDRGNWYVFLLAVQGVRKRSNGRVPLPCHPHRCLLQLCCKCADRYLSLPCALSCTGVLARAITRTQCPKATGRMNYGRHQNSRREGMLSPACAARG